MTSDKFSVVIADDEAHIRSILRHVVQKEGMLVVGEAADGQAALELYRLHKPDLLLLDINMPVRNGDEVLLDVLKESPAARVIMLTMVADAEVVKRCLDAGALNYILKSNSTDEIRRILRAVRPPAGKKEDEA
jgi:DNA-binding NarL/FixJ family response regulator